MTVPPFLDGWSVVDLSLTLDERYPVSWPGATPFQHHLANTMDSRIADAPTGGGPYVTHTLMLDEHTGTHFDAPSHFIPPPGSGLPHEGPAGLVTGDVVPLADLLGRAVVIDCRSLSSSKPGVSPIITPSLIEADEALYGAVEPGDAVLFWTGWADEHMRPRPDGDTYVLRPFTVRDAPGWPAPDVAAAEYLFAKGVHLLATDATTMGPAHDGAPVHWWGLGHGMLFVEGCAGFEQLPRRGAVFQFLPLKVRNSSGGPGRAVAFVPPAGS
jgi:kynurenine formamidase